MLSNKPEGDAYERSQTKAGSGVVWAQEAIKVGPRYDSEYVWPKEQKNKFLSNNKIANDTKIYKQFLPGYYESGVKTKTMKKSGLIWNKFDANVTSGIVNMMIYEAGDIAITNYLPLGWIDVNNTHYSGKSYIIATRVVPSYSYVPLSGTGVTSDCNSALAWANSNGASISSIDGVRYIVKNDPNNWTVRIKDNEVTIYDSKNTIINNIKTGGDTFYTDLGVFNQFAINSSFYRVDMIHYYGYSEYNGETRGSYLKCERFGIE